MTYRSGGRQSGGIPADAARRDLLAQRLAVPRQRQARDDAVHVHLGPIDGVEVGTSSGEPGRHGVRRESSVAA